MKSLGIPHQYACFVCRKSFKRPQFSATTSRFMTSEQQSAQSNETVQFNAGRTYPCPDCGGVTYFMGTDFKAPKKTDIRAWQQAKEFIDSGCVFYRGSQDVAESKA